MSRDCRSVQALIAVCLIGACGASVEPSRRSPPAPPASRERDHDGDRGEPRVLEGVVRDAVTHQPIDRASVDVTPAGVRDPITVQTGSDGRYRTGEIPRGALSIRVRHQGYEPVRRTADTGDRIAHLDFELVPTRN